MRIQLPTRIPLSKALLFTGVLVLVELLEGTWPLYALLVFCYFMFSVMAFNVAGGFTRPSGAYIFFYSTLAGGVGTVYKALLGQAAQTHLEAPLITIAVYAATTVTLLLAAFVARKIATSREGIAGVLHVPRLNLNTAALGCVVMVVLIDNAYAIFPGGAGSILHAITMVNYFLPLGILLGTIAAVRNSGGRHSVSLLTLSAMVYAMALAMASFSKQAMFTPFVCWFLGAAWAGFQLRQRHILAILVFAFVAQEFLVPLANVGREEITDESASTRFALVERYVEHPFRLREVNEQRLSGYLGLSIWYFGTPQGIFDRFTMLPNDAQLVAYTAEGHYFGYLPLYVYFQNWVPHIINPHKLEGTIVGGNRYAHELGQLADEDWTTGISYTPSAEAFHIDGWTSVLIAQPFIFLLLFVTTDAICGDLRSQPWGLLPMLVFAHIAPEGLLGAAINYVWLGNVGTVFAIFISGYVAPVFGRLLKGRDRTPIWRSGLPLATTSPMAGADAA